MRILLVEDDRALATSVELILKAENAAVDTTDLGEEGLDLGRLYDYDLIILDLNLPDLNGYDVLRRLRSARIDTPVLILSGMSEPDKKVKGLGYGADDYLTKPFNKDELVARVRAIVRRARGHSESVIWVSTSSLSTLCLGTITNGRVPNLPPWASSVTRHGTLA